MSSGSAVATAFASATARSLGGSPEADADCGLHRQNLEDRTCAGLVVRGCWYGFLLRRLSHGGVPDLEFDDMSRMLSRSVSFNDKGFIFDEPP